MRLLWLDIETDGLDPHEHQVLEIAWKLIDEDGDCQSSFERVIRTHDFANSEEGAVKVHRENGLLADCICSSYTLEGTRETIEQMMRRQPFASRGDIHLAGNSVHFDRRFIKSNFAALDDRLHYRMVDVSSHRIMRSWGGLPDLMGLPDSPHRAMGDVERSIAIFNAYQNELGMLKASGIREVAAERQRQISKGFDAAHDDQHSDGKLINVAMDLLAGAHDAWDITEKWTDPFDRQRIAAALIVAEMERRMRCNVDLDD